jgi:hypothetical protein
MSFRAKLYIDGAELNILSLSYSLSQAVDEKGLPSSVLKIDSITMTLESTGRTSFFEWICNSFLRKNGRIALVKRDSDATLKEILFKNAYLVHYKEDFHSNGDNPVTETLVLSAEEIACGAGSYKTTWN